MVRCQLWSWMIKTLSEVKAGTNFFFTFSFFIFRALFSPQPSPYLLFKSKQILNHSTLPLSPHSAYIFLLSCPACIFLLSFIIVNQKNIYIYKYMYVCMYVHIYIYALREKKSSESFNNTNKHGYFSCINLHWEETLVAQQQKGTAFWPSILFFWFFLN